MPSLKVKTHYIEKLKRLGIYDMWLANIKEQWDESGAKSATHIYNAADWYDFIYWSLNWHSTPEGHTYWRCIANR